MNNQPAAGRTAALAGFLIALMTVSASIAQLWPGLLSPWVAGLFAWLAAALLVPRMPRSQVVQIGVLSLIGIVTLSCGMALGARPPWLRLLDSNAGLLSMLAAVSFLRLVAIQAVDTSGSAPRGAGSFRRTMLAVALFGGFINISAPVLIADRVSGKNGLSPFAAQSIIRIFTGAPAWSPFFAGMAVVLTYIQSASLPFIMMFGLPFAVVGFFLVLAEAKLFYRDELEKFEGFPMTPASLWVPSVLALGVAAGHTLMPRVSITIIIALAALSVTVIGLVAARGMTAAMAELIGHIRGGLPRMAGELSLFLAAGVLAVGLSTLVAASHFDLPFAGGFGAPAAAVLLAGMVFISSLGLHPVISIAVITPLLQPLGPDPQLLAVTYLFVWSLGTCASPLSGISLIFQGRYGIPGFKSAMRNWPFVAVMVVVGVAILKAVALVRGV